MKDRQRFSSPRLSPRLQTIVNQLRQPYSVWDLCCDHGLVGQKAFSMQGFSAIYFVDQVAHILDWLKNDFLQRFGLHELPDNVFFIKDDVKSVALPLREANVVIGGVGAFLICKVVERLRPGPYLRLILAPNKNVALVKERALKQGFIMKDELVVIEDQRERHILIFDSPSLH